MRRISVLIVDDHEAVRLILRRRFEVMSDFQVVGEAANGVEAVQKAQQLVPDIVILDFAMPEMNGLEAATALKLMMPSVRVYLLTVHSTREVQLAAREAGVDGVYSKHQDLNVLLRRAQQDGAAKPGGETEEKATDADRGPGAPVQGKNPNDKSAVH